MELLDPEIRAYNKASEASKASEANGLANSMPSLCIDFNATIDKMASSSLGIHQAVKAAMRGHYTDIPVGIYYHLDKKALSLDSRINKIPEKQKVDLKGKLEKIAMVIPAHAVQGARFTGELEDPDWIKVGYSSAIDTAGKYLNFWKGKYPGGIPNSPGAIQSMLTTGILGAGAGYGAGWLGEQMLPRKFKKNRLRYYMAALGGAAGAAPGAALMAYNVSNGKPFNSADLLKESPTLARAIASYDKSSGDSMNTAGHGGLGSIGGHVTSSANFESHARECIRREFIKESSYGGYGNYGAGNENSSALDVNVDNMGKVLWEVGASPQSAAMTMGTLHAAEKMPGQRTPGWVTPGQIGRLGYNMGGGYLTGALVGKTLGTLMGMPQSTQDMLKRTGVYLGIVNTVVPELFSR